MPDVKLALGHRPCKARKDPRAHHYSPPAPPPCSALTWGWALLCKVLAGSPLQSREAVGWDEVGTLRAVVREPNQRVDTCLKPAGCRGQGSAHRKPAGAGVLVKVGSGAEPPRLARGAQGGP